jgi:uncharacterized protein (TIGR02271 family)
MNANRRQGEPQVHEADMLHAQPNSDASETVIPVKAERLQVDVEKVVTGGYRVTRSPTVRSELVDVPVTRQRWRIERRPVGRLVEGEPPVAHYEGDTLVVPILEEVVVVQKRLRLAEEVLLHVDREVQRFQQPVELRSQRVDIERVEAEELGDS